MDSLREHEPTDEALSPARLDHLVRLPSTDALSRISQDAMESIQRLRRERVWDVGALRAAEFQVQSADRNLEDGMQRDALAASRPEGCWCLGVGGKQRRYTVDNVEVFSTYCECPEGIAAKEAGERERRRVMHERTRLRIAELLDESGIPGRFWSYTFAGFPATEATRETVERVRLWILGPESLPDDVEGDEVWRKWREGRCDSLLLWGPFGSGKTGLAIATLKAHIRTNEESGLFITVPALLDRIRQGYDRDSGEKSDEILTRVKDEPFLVLDDLGAERVTDWVAERLFVIINHRHDEDLPTVFTSNLSPEQMAGHIGERTMWRIIEMCDVIHLDGPNLRDRAS